MVLVDYIVLIVYVLGMLGVGFYFMNKNKSLDDYYVGGRDLGYFHVGMSVVATDVGGGFSIGLGGLGFAIVLSGAWMLFTGLIGAWLSAVFLIPKIKRLEQSKNFYTFPDFFSAFYDKKVSIAAAVITIIGYIGFTSSQFLAGAKLASATFPELDLTTCLIGMGVVAIIYTSIGGIKAVIYTDTIQWIILMIGLFFIGVPLSYYKLGGYDEIVKYLPAEFLTFTNITVTQILNWAITIIPIWFVGMTLYQRIFSCKNEKEAKKAWFVAGLLEFPIMAFMGVLLGMFGRVALMKGMFPLYSGEGFDITSFDSELGLPMLLTHIFPPGLTGLMIAAYLSAVLSTADSCLMAASGSFVSDFYKKVFGIEDSKHIRLSQMATLLIGVLAIVLATNMENVLTLMLKSYSVMVSGLFIPVMAILFLKKNSSKGAFASLIIGGSTTLILEFDILGISTQLNPNICGIGFSAIAYFLFSYFDKKIKNFA